jgi:hypothetical protein
VRRAAKHTFEHVQGPLARLREGVEALEDELAHALPPPPLSVQSPSPSPLANMPSGLVPEGSEAPEEAAHAQAVPGTGDTAVAGSDAAPEPTGETSLALPCSPPKLAELAGSKASGVAAAGPDFRGMCAEIAAQSKGVARRLSLTDCAPSVTATPAEPPLPPHLQPGAYVDITGEVIVPSMAPDLASRAAVRMRFNVSAPCAQPSTKQQGVPAALSVPERTGSDAQPSLSLGTEAAPLMVDLFGSPFPTAGPVVDVPGSQTASDAGSCSHRQNGSTPGAGVIAAEHLRDDSAAACLASAAGTPSRCSASGAEQPASSTVLSPPFANSPANSSGVQAELSAAALVNNRLRKPGPGTRGAGTVCASHPVDRQPAAHTAEASPQADNTATCTADSAAQVERAQTAPPGACAEAAEGGAAPGSAANDGAASPLSAALSSTLIQAGVQRAPPGSLLALPMPTFLERAQRDVTELERKAQRVLEEFIDLMKFFAQPVPPDSVLRGQEPEQFLGHTWQFVGRLEAAAKERAKVEECLRLPEGSEGA